MSKASRRSSRSRPAAISRRPGRVERRRPWALLALAGVTALALGVVAVVLIGRPGNSSAAAWSRLGTDDVHSLAFVDDDPSRLLFGHHGGVLSSSDGGRTWQSLPSRSDAMSLGAATDGSIVIAGHEVFAQSRDGGRTWKNISANLPTLDIHGFTRDPKEPDRMWAYLATGGLWGSADGGLTWEQVQQENVLFPVAVASGSGTRLYGVLSSGLAASDDEGRTWRGLASPELYPMAALTASSDGTVLVAGGPDGLARSDDGGSTWAMLPFDGEPATIAITGDVGRTIAVVTRSTDFFRSDDAGQTWPGP